MSHKADISSFNELSQQQFSKFEKRLMQLTPAFPYPPTPDFTRRERQRLEANRNSKIPQRRLAIGLVLLFIALAAALLITPVRAQILDWFRIGSVKIFISSPTDANSTGTPAPAVTPTFLETILDLAGETTLVDAREQADFSIGLPSYPSDLPMPDKVFVQKFNGPVVTLVWMDSS
ncbi:hypothetical protein EG832_14095, partial [bacterium]|nr:hypothetical protein [bacterium]